MTQEAKNALAEVINAINEKSTKLAEDVKKETDLTVLPMMLGGLYALACLSETLTKLWKEEQE